MILKFIRLNLILRSHKRNPRLRETVNVWVILHLPLILEQVLIQNGLSSKTRKGLRTAGPAPRHFGRAILRRPGCS